MTVGTVVLVLALQQLLELPQDSCRWTGGAPDTGRQTARFEPSKTDFSYAKRNLKCSTPPRYSAAVRVAAAAVAIGRYRCV